MKKISEIAKVPAEIREGVSGTVSVAFDDVPFEEGVERVLRAAGTRNFAAVYQREPSRPAEPT